MYVARALLESQFRTSPSSCPNPSLASPPSLPFHLSTPLFTLPQSLTFRTTDLDSIQVAHDGCNATLRVDASSNSVARFVSSTFGLGGNETRLSLNVFISANPNTFSDKLYVAEKGRGTGLCRQTIE